MIGAWKLPQCRARGLGDEAALKMAKVLQRQELLRCCWWENPKSQRQLWKSLKRRPCGHDHVGDEQDGCMPSLGQVAPEDGEKGGKVLLLDGQALELTRCLKLVEWRSWHLVGCNAVF